MLYFTGMHTERLPGCGPRLCRKVDQALMLRAIRDEACHPAAGAALRARLRSCGSAVAPCRRWPTPMPAVTIEESGSGALAQRADAMQPLLVRLASCTWNFASTTSLLPIPYEACSSGSHLCGVYRIPLAVRIDVLHRIDLVRELVLRSQQAHGEKPHPPCQLQYCTCTGRRIELPGL